MSNATRFRIPWSRLTAEGGIIVVSILLAFAIQAWWEGRKDAELERQALSILFDEVYLMESLFRMSDGVSDQVAGAGAYLLSAMREPEGRPADSIAAALIDLRSVSTTDASLTTYDMLVNSGRLDVVSNPELAAHLVTLRTLISVKDRLEQEEKKFMEERLEPFLMPFLRPGAANQNYFLSKGVDPGPRPEFGVDYRPLLADPVFLNLVEIRVAKRAASEFFVGRVEDEIAALKRLAEDQVGDRTPAEARIDSVLTR